MNTYNMDKMYESFAGSMEMMQRWLDESEQENKKYKEVINKAIKLIEDNYYSKNTTDIDSIVVSGDKLIQVRKILKEVE